MDDLRYIRDCIDGGGLNRRCGKSEAQRMWIKACLKAGQRVLIAKHTHYEVHYKVGHLTRIITCQYDSNRP